MRQTVETVLGAQLGGRWQVKPLGRSAFCATWRAQAAGRSDAASPAYVAAGQAGTGELFVKSTPVAQAPVLESEADGLQALAAAGAVATPRIVGCWVDPAQDVAVLALNWLDLSSAAGTRFGERLGHSLAALHLGPLAAGDGRFGWRRDNWIGGTPQTNGWSVHAGVAGWLEFFGERRLGAMAEKLAAAGQSAALVAAVRRVIDALGSWFDDGYVPRPSLIHGDLWAGNWGALSDGSAVIFDPAVSVSDAEAELAMMELFGQPPAGFWPAYREVFPLHANYARRRPLYQLYHLLNHTLLFGGGYAAQSMAVVEQLLARR